MCQERHKFQLVCRKGGLFDIKIFLYGTMLDFPIIGMEYMTKSLILTKHSSYLDFY